MPLLPLLASGAKVGGHLTVPPRQMQHETPAEKLAVSRVPQSGSTLPITPWCEAQVGLSESLTVITSLSVQLDGGR